MDVYQRDYVTQGEMNYMGPSAVGHLQHAAMNGENIHVVKGRARPPTFRQNHIISTCHIYICFRCIIGVIILTRYVEEFRYSHNIWCIILWIFGQNSVFSERHKMWWWCSAAGQALGKYWIHDDRNSNNRLIIYYPTRKQSRVCDSECAPSIEDIFLEIRFKTLCRFNIQKARCLGLIIKQICSYDF